MSTTKTSKPNPPAKDKVVYFQKRAASQPKPATLALQKRERERSETSRLTQFLRIDRGHLT